jgi:radical SAM superfamily enzyme YgiQ (UPF0313 family)
LDRNILLVEPGYPTKFPPLGLMKISTYHKELGDNVTFYKGIKDEAYYTYWDRIYISTVFSYHWKVTVDTILFYKNIVRGDLSRIVVGGIMSSLLPKELWKATGIMPTIGVIDKPHVLDKDNDLVVEDMIPDYKLFDDSQHKYSLVGDSYFGYSTRGCVRKCEFCGVPKLEPKFIDYQGIKPYVQGIAERYGEKEHLVLFDNNILASRRFEQVIRDLKELGFERGAKFSYKKNGQTYSRQRHVDFNQGTDARLMKERHLRLLSQIALHPLRIAFDHIKDRKTYEEKIRLAAKYGIKNLSNYILYNYDDTPEELWQRLKINIDLNKELGLKIYSFPMKYIPLDHRDRTYIDEPRWNYQYVRGVQRILNVLKGTVMASEDFFYRAFGENEKEFIEILHMPEKTVMHRGAEPKKEEKQWIKRFRALTNNEKNELLYVLCVNKGINQLKQAVASTANGKLKALLELYIPDDKQQHNLQLFED